MSKTESFLLYSTLESEHKEDKDPRDEVQVMTLHKSKGLEFKTVFLVGVEENILPSFESVKLQRENPKLLEEERRLMYVGITRAKQRLFMSFADNRVQYGNFIANPPSRFLLESVGDVNLM
jgi:superfamily I DNA/RNA helicase